MRAGVLLRWVAHPLTVAATAVLLLNDHVFKQAWPGFVTGKLSDVAGLVVAPALLGLLLGVVRGGAAVAVLLTGAGFTWVKLTATGADVASAAWSVVNGPSVVLADPTDLVALPALGLAWFAWRRAAAAPTPPDHLVHRARVVLAVPFAVLAVAATSAPGDTIPSVDAIDISGDQVVIAAYRQYYSSGSGTGEWTLLPEEPPGNLREQRQAEACAPDDATHCYRVHGVGELDFQGPLPHGGRLLGVDETTDGGRTWRTAWEVPAARWPFVARQHRSAVSSGRLSEVASVDIAVRAVPGGHEVFVANSAEGLTVRDAGGTWRQLPFVVPATNLNIRPAPLTGFGQVIGGDVLDAALVALAALLLGMSVAVRRTRLEHILVVVLPLGFLLLAAFPIIGVAGLVISELTNSTASGLVLALPLTGAGFGLAMAQRAVPRSRAAVVGAVAVLTGLAYLVPFLGWTLGVPAAREPAGPIGLALAGVSAVLVVATGWWAGREPRDSALR
ncbi:hypothetical protein [Lentzea sp. NPDC003310]|uniref:hypothetical protein n=1 Tax=Lentzea sp. NPDC003310 TaxID=3154447 RepID=UPI0033A03BA2